MPRVSFLLLAGWLSGLAWSQAAPLTATLVAPGRVESSYFKMGSARSPSGHVLTVDSRSLRLDGERWLPVMGEFHFSRYPSEEWRDELLKMKAGGVDIVSTYVFWIHHEETEGNWDWTGQRDLRRFVETAREVGLDVVVRCGPWCHGEVRNGGLPEWVVERNQQSTRTTDPNFLALVQGLYGQIATQLNGLLWKDGGPVIGIQLDNEYGGPADYLLALKAIARDVGLDVPLYTRTGWPALKTPMPLGEVLPLYGVYAEGFWDRELTSMPGRYWTGYQFSTRRSDAAIATDLLGEPAANDATDARRYPYLTCEIGGGMMASYHRRILIDPRDIESTTLVKLADGGTLIGYYMFHGGTNPDGKWTTLMEAQDTRSTNYNDLPVKTYDFQAPLGEYGQIRPQYHLLRRLHLFLRDDGSDLCEMVTALPDQRPNGPDDTSTLRWAVRSDGRRGVVFVNNYERGHLLPQKAGVQFALALTNGTSLVFPTQPVTIPSGMIAWWPFNLNLGGVTLVSATARPVTHAVEGNGTRTLFFAASDGVPAEFVFAADQVVRIETCGQMDRTSSHIIVRGLASGHSAAIRLLTTTGNIIQVVLLNEEDSLALWKGPLAGRNRVLLTHAAVVFDRDALRLTATRAGDEALWVFPAPASASADGKGLTGMPDGVFYRYTVPISTTTVAIAPERLAAPGPPREIKIAPGLTGVAMQPRDADFAAAARWRIRLPRSFDHARHPMLRINYVGDVLRVTIGGRFITDDFYHGRARDIGMWRYAREVQREPLVVSILPLQPQAPIFIDRAAQPAVPATAPVAAIRNVELELASTATITATARPEPTLPANFRTDRATPVVRPGL